MGWISWGLSLCLPFGRQSSNNNLCFQFRAKVWDEMTGELVYCAPLRSIGQRVMSRISNWLPRTLHMPFFMPCHVLPLCEHFYVSDRLNVFRLCAHRCTKDFVFVKRENLSYVGMKDTE